MRKLMAAALTILGAALAYRAFVRQRILDFGARPDEVARRLPGDDLLEGADIVATRAITIDAPPSAIWPWLLQMGPGRGGVYTYDWIENLFGLNMHSADEIVPAWQTTKVGDEWHNPQGGGMRIVRLEPERVLAMRSFDGSWVWSFVIVDEDEGTRFLSRNRFLMKGGALKGLFEMLVMEPGSLVMERKMLLGIKERAERLARESGPIATAVTEATPPPAPEPGPAGPIGEPVMAGGAGEEPAGQAVGEPAGVA
jgi:hypothetical protein